MCTTALNSKEIGRVEWQMGNLKRHSSHGKGPEDVEELRCCPTRHAATGYGHE